jgi:hypothetical protein
MKSLAFLGYPNHRITRSGVCWSKESGKWRRLNWVGRGYPIVGLCRKSKQTLFFVHRLLLLAFVGPCPEGMECRHLDGDKRNCRLPNLCWGTKQENNGLDKRAHGTASVGERNGNVRLTEEKVRRIRALWRTGRFVPRELGERFGVHKDTIRQIVKGKTWKAVA